jgi:hypothetical protein
VLKELKNKKTFVTDISCTIKIKYCEFGTDADHTGLHTQKVCTINILSTATELHFKSYFGKFDLRESTLDDIIINITAVTVRLET